MELQFKMGSKMDKIIGYTAGTFDMFHIGHLNLLKHAKENCDYLVVGVNSDELVNSYKQKKVVIPLEERLLIVQAIRYVDEAVRMDTLDKKVSWEMKHYNRLFIGDDWKGSSRWNQTEADMKELGVEVCYLPYTKETNSTLLREKLLDL